MKDLELITEVKKEQNKEFKAIIFMDKEIDCILVEGEPRVIVNSVIEAIGLNYNHAHNFINNDPKLSKGCRSYNTPFKKYWGQEVKTFNLKFFLVWLMKIDANNASAEASVILEAFQDNAYDVLHEHFFGKQKEIASNSIESYQLEVQIKSLKTELKQLESKDHLELKESIKLLQSQKKELDKKQNGILTLDFERKVL